MLIIRFPLFIMLACGLSGCASWSAPTVQPAAIAPDQISGQVKAIDKVSADNKCS